MKFLNLHFVFWKQNVTIWIGWGGEGDPQDAGVVNVSPNIDKRSLARTLLHPCKSICYIEIWPTSFVPGIYFIGIFLFLLQYHPVQANPKNMMHCSWKNGSFIQETSVWLVPLSLSSPDNQSTQLSSSCSRVLPRFAFWNCTHSTFQSLGLLTLLPPSI